MNVLMPPYKILWPNPFQNVRIDPSQKYIEYLERRIKELEDIINPPEQDAQESNPS
jgi:hypothetical protein